MKTLFIALILIHGVIHLLGFVKAFRLAPVNQLSQPISKASGSLWLLSAILFVLAALLFAFQIEWWWILSACGILVSEFLVINDWEDAWFGTVANVIIFMITCIGFGVWYLIKK
jgi:hypothetical protein